MFYFNFSLKTGSKPRKLLKSIAGKTKKKKREHAEQTNSILGEISPGSFLKARRKHVPVHLRFKTPKRSVKGKFFMKRRLPLHTGSFRERELPCHCYRPEHKPIICFFLFFCTLEKWGLKKVERERKTRRFKENTESRGTAGMPDQMGVQEGDACFRLGAAMGGEPSV